MNRFLKNENLLKYVYLSLSAFLIVGTIAIATGIFVSMSSTEADKYRTFTVNAEATELATPDIAEFRFTILGKNKSMEELEASHAQRYKTIMDILDDLSIAEEDIKTIDYTVKPEYTNTDCIGMRLCPSEDIVGYSMEQTTSVIVRDLSKASQILKEVTISGADEVTRLEFRIENEDIFENRARSKAIALAKTKAQSMARSGGFKIGKLISVYDNRMDYGGYKTMRQGIAMDEMSVPSFEILMDSTVDNSVSEAETPELQMAPGSKEITINVSLTYSMK